MKVETFLSCVAARALRPILHCAEGLQRCVRPVGRELLPAWEEGQALVEFALVAPVILLVLTGICSLGIAMNQYELLTFGTGDGARAFALSRGQANWSPTTASDPCEYTYDTAMAAMPTLNASNLTMTITFTPPSGSDHTAKTWSNVSATSGCSGFTLDGTDINGSIQVQTTYPVLPVIWGHAMSLNLTANTAQQIQ